MIVLNNASGLSTVWSWAKALGFIFNCPVRQLADRAIDVHNILGFSHINKKFIAFLC